MVFFVTTVAFVQTLVVLYLLPLRGNQSRSYPYIRALLGALILHLGIKLYLLGVLHDEFLFGRLNSFTSFSYGPLLLFQFRQSIGKPLHRSTQLLHLIPFLTAFGLYLYCVVTLLPAQNLVLFQTIFSVYKNSVMASWVLYFGYLLWAIWRENRQEVSRLAEVDRWLLLRVSGLFLIALGGSQVFKAGAGWLGVAYESHTFPYLIFGLISFLCLRFFFTQNPVAALPVVVQPAEASPVAPEKEAVSYEKSGLTEGQLAEGWQLLEQVMQRDKLYINPELSLDDLSARVKLPRQHVSQILNQKAERNFFTYVNEYRVGEMQRLMKAKPNGRILELAFRVGFQSKTTLNTYFKKVTGYSPTQYQQFLMAQKPERLRS